MSSIYYAAAVVLAAMWAYGFVVARMDGPMLHALLAAAAVIAVYQWRSGRRTVQ